jgi:hypothetical protein
MAHSWTEQQSGFSGFESRPPVSRVILSHLRERDAADIIHALASPKVYGLLVVDRGWSPERYESWLRQILIDQLLP